MSNYFHSAEQIPAGTVFDAILVLGGGVPEDIRKPPIYTQERCRAASEVYHRLQNQAQSSGAPPKILTLSAGTAHLPQALSADGLPIWESTASAAYLIHELDVPPQDLFAETTSYDTISNAFFARLNFCDIAQWRKLLVITNEFHMERTKIIFDWIFHAPSDTMKNDNYSGGDESPYELFYLSVPDVGLSEDAIKARREKEGKSAATVKNHLSQKYTSIEKVFEFLTSEHSFYTASSLVERGMDDGTAQDKVGKLVQDSYGGISRGGRGRDGTPRSSPSSSFLSGMIVGMGLMALMLFSSRRGSGKRHFL
mmetsp:Transcript_14974/g.22672  ORF Transcript_14974/g.22672 Transcript_14974/m.22672 type:complete len:310 (+) Transcript_14974:60-989(+)